MDHSSAHIMEFANPIETKIIESGFTHEEKGESIEKSENLLHHKEQHKQSEYYKKLAAIIRNHEKVILFGPTNAKSELHNILKADHLFANIHIDVKQTDKMTEHQEHAFVREYFSKSNFL